MKLETAAYYYFPLRDFSTLLSFAEPFPPTGLPPGGDYSKIQFKTCKRAMACKKCENCLKEDCMKCKYCEDRNKNGGKGNLKKVCM